MTSDRKDKHFRIPIKFMDADPESENEVLSTDSGEEIPLDDLAAEMDESESEPVGGPATAELIATRSELKRVEGENAELKSQLARRQADFENYRKRVDRERNETYNRVVADIAAKLLPVSDNLKRALEAAPSGG